MTNDTIDLAQHPTSPHDSFWYWIVGKLGDLQDFIIRYKIKEPVWRSFDGRVHVPSTMSNSHLANTIRMIDRLVEDGEPEPAQYPALQKEFSHRQHLASVRWARAHAEQIAKDTEDQARRKQQLELVAVDYVPEGWIRMHVADDSPARIYKTEIGPGAKVSLNRHGYWSWWKAHLHHIACTDPKTTLEEALAAALEGQIEA